MLEPLDPLNQELIKLFERCFMINNLFWRSTTALSIQSGVQEWEDFIKNHDCLPQAMQVAGQNFVQVKDKIESGRSTYTPSLYIFLYAFKYDHHDLALLLLSLVNFAEMNCRTDPDFYNDAKLIMLLKKMFDETLDKIKYNPSGMRVICCYIRKMLKDLQPFPANEIMNAIPLYKIIKSAVGLTQQDGEAILKNLRLTEKAEDNNNTLYADNLYAMVVMGVQIPSFVDRKDHAAQIIPNVQKYQELQRKMAYLLVSHFVKLSCLPYDIKVKVLFEILPVLTKMDEEVVSIAIEALKKEPQVTQENESAFAEQRRYVAIRGYHTFLEKNGCPGDLQKTVVQFNRRLIDSRLQFFQSQSHLPKNLTTPLRQKLVAEISAEVDTSPLQHHAVTFKQKIVDEGIKRTMVRP
jgi:hypothetical protein